MCLARMRITPVNGPPNASGQHSGQSMALGLASTSIGPAFPKSQLSLETGVKLANLDWPPPPSPSSACRLSAQASGAAVLPTRAAPELETSDALALGHGSAASDMRARADLWQIRADIEREKLKRVAPYPFIGRSMRFQDDYAALQITDDGRFSFSELSVELGKSEEAGESDTTATDGEKQRKALAANGEKPKKTIARSRPQDVKHMLTYEGVFATPHLLPPTDEEEIVTSKESASGSKSKEANSEEAQTAVPEIAAIEATGLVRHQIVEASGKCRLTSVERGEFRFVITVSPLFPPAVYATVKAVSVRRSASHTQPRARRLPFVEAPYVAASIPNRPSKPTAVSGLTAPGLLTKSRSGGSLKPTATFQRAAVGSLKATPSIGSLGGRQRGLLGSYSMPHL